MNKDDQERYDYVKTLQDAILRLHDCEAEYVETVPVTEVFQGKTVWDGQVEVFNIRGHPKAKRAYAWGHLAGENDETMRYIAVLELPPVMSPQTAVQAATLSEIKSARKETKGRTA